MKFRIAGSKILCSRKDQTVEGDAYRDVVEFDAKVDSVPPHVAARLTTGEVRDLERFLADRKQIKADPLEINLLEALPELIEEVTDALSSADQLNDDLYERLTTSIAGLTEVLGEVRPRKQGGAASLREMRSTEALKQRLDVIKREL